MRVAPWIARAGVSGSLASITSTIALCACGVREGTTALAPVNAVSHWFWGDKALRHNDSTLAYTATGYAIHHAMSLLWALAYEGWRGARRERRAWRLSLVGALAVAAGACFVDLRCTPQRLTPGFERRLGPGSLTLVYGAFAAGLALWRWKESREDAWRPGTHQSKNADTGRGARPSSVVSGPGSPVLPR